MRRIGGFSCGDLDCEVDLEVGNCLDFFVLVADVVSDERCVNVSY